MKEAAHPLKRLFVGISVPHNISTQLFEMSRKLKKSADIKDLAVMWTPKENWHLTILFLGDTSIGKAVELQALLKDFFADEQPFEISIRKLGAFPDVRGARYIWAGVAKSHSLLNLRQKLAIALEPWALKPDEHEFVPHITLGRLRNHKNITDLLSPWIRSDFGKFQVCEATLFESQQVGPHSRYIPLVRYPLVNH